MNNAKKETAPLVGNYVTPLVISAIGILATVLVLASFFFIFWWLYVRPHRRHPTINNTYTSRAHIRNNGVDEDTLKKIPLITFSSQDYNPGQIELECSICLGELKDGEVLRLLPVCSHAFHVPCIDEWFKEHNNCPYCRSLIVYENDEPADNREISDDQERVVTNGNDGDDNNNNNRITTEDDDENNGVSSNSSNSTNSRFQRPKRPYCVPLCPMKKKPRSLGMMLKRSFSMDQSSYLYVAVTIQQRDHQSVLHEGVVEASTSSTPPPSSSPSNNNNKGVMVMNRYKSRSLSMKHIDQMSKALVRSFSQFRNGSFDQRSNNVILPY
ncbi:hypothetical protein PIB30_007985 [Stylosanthes scabra]|uniref:RING-type E3 ubiquitin transferase n=1 Tax=Stylosanthes scabra TaxID=79078 RepID=A0ABU6U482_9FABA|nr:hypothetical protein [Stylosanthes scabra]